MIFQNQQNLVALVNIYLLCLDRLACTGEQFQASLQSVRISLKAYLGNYLPIY